MRDDLRTIGCVLLIATGLAGAEPPAAKDRANEPTAASPGMARKITALVQGSSAVARGRVGFKFEDVESGAVVAEQNASRFFTPASNAKLYTTALALVRLGGAYQFRTQVRTSGGWHTGQDTIADLQIVGGGDPNLSGRTMPYLVDAPEGDARAALGQLADQIVAAGIQDVSGDVVGVSGRYVGPAYPDGWTLDDSIYSYGAPVSALSFNDNSMGLILRPTEVGELADVELRPASMHFVVMNQVITDGSREAHIKVEREPGSNELVVTGTIGRQVEQWREDVAAEDGALLAAETFVDLLEERGVRVGGVAGASYDSGDAAATGGTVLGERMSQPLSQVLQVVNKTSQNLHAEMLLCEVAKVRTGVGSLENGQKERATFLQEAGISRDGTGFAVDDGSGLARQDLTTPDSTVALLRFMWGRADREVWVDSFPIGGWDGSLQHRFRRIVGAERIHGKTGSLSHVNSLSGYIETREHRHIAFAVMVNGTAGHEADVREFIDKLCALFL